MNRGLLAWVAACAVACGASQPATLPPAPTATPEEIAIAAPTATTPPDDSSQDADAVVQPETPPATDDVATSPPPPIQANAALQAIAGATCPSPPGTGAPPGLSSGGRPFWAGAHRGLALLVTEIQQLEELFQVTKPGSADRPLLERRLAMAYYELEAAAYRDCVAVSSAQPTSASDAERRAASVRARGRTIAAAREMAIKDCTMLHRDFPAFAQTHACPVR